MSEGQLRIFVRCESGELLSLSMNPKSTCASLRSLVELSSSSGRPIFITLKNGRRLDNEKTLSEEGLGPETELLAHQITDEEMKEELERKRKVQKQIEDLYLEVIRLRDLRLNNYCNSVPLSFENRYNSSLSKSNQADDSSSDEDSSANDSTVIRNFENYESLKRFNDSNISSSTTSKPSSEPLPAFWDTNEQEEEEEEEKFESIFSQFSSVSQASSFFRNEGWTW